MRQGLERMITTFDGPFHGAHGHRVAARVAHAVPQDDGHGGVGGARLHCSCGGRGEDMSCHVRLGPAEEGEGVKNHFPPRRERRGGAGRPRTWPPCVAGRAANRSKRRDAQRMARDRGNEGAK